MPHANLHLSGLVFVQAPLETMPWLLAAMAPLKWMEELRVEHLNIWIGDGLFRNTLHNDHYDNFLCLIRGRKHVLLWPPEQRDNLAYATRIDVRASYLPSRGVHARRETNVTSDNTAGPNLAEPAAAAKAFPRLAEARKFEVRASLEPGDCLYRRDTGTITFSLKPIRRRGSTSRSTSGRIGRRRSRRRRQQRSFRRSRRYSKPCTRRSIQLTTSERCHAMRRERSVANGSAKQRRSSRALG